jgi:hypothetical protein
MSQTTGFYFFLLAGALVVAGKHFELPWLSAISVIFIGMYAIAGGIRAIIKGKAVMGRTRISNPGYIERYRGLPARLMGFIIAFAGLVFFILGIAGILYKGGANVFLGDLAGSKYGLPLMLGLAGLVGTSWGIVRFMTGTATAPGIHAGYIEFSIKLGGIIVMAISLICLVLAIWEVFQPGFIAGLFAQLAEWVKMMIRL